MSRPLQIVSSIMVLAAISLGVNAILPPPPTPEGIRAYMASPEYLIDKAAVFRAAEERAKHNF